MDWINTGFYRDYGYGLAYPQIFPHHKRPTDEAQAATLAWGKERAANWLSILDKHFIGPDNAYLCGNDITIADYFGIGIVTLGEVIKCDFTPYPNVQRWMSNMKKLPNWDKVNEVFNGFVGSVRDVPYEAL
jgi:glutathione S-transferase